MEINRIKLKEDCRLVLKCLNAFKDCEKSDLNDLELQFDFLIEDLRGILNG
tara:strand:+ start:538 stop:690 length:153 start_codon:yes stop_codon:yes gene_type:complete